MVSTKKTGARRPRKTAGGSPITYAPVYTNYTDMGGDPFVRPEDLPIAHVKHKNGTTYEVPLDPKTGKVPVSAVFARFLDTDSGSRDGHPRSVKRDLSKTAEITYKIPKDGFTPEEIVKCDWWAYPNESDIIGIDDPTSFGMYPWEKLTERNADSVSKIMILGKPEEQKRIQGVLRDNFTMKELRDAVKDQGIVIKVGSTSPGVAGYYRGKQPGVSTPEIVVRPFSSEDTITHEFVHHMRRADPSRKGIALTPFPLDEDRALDRSFFSLSEKERGTMTNIEEAATVAEATVRTRKPEQYPTGYYSYVQKPKGSYIDMYNADRDVMTKGSKKNTPQRGKRATTRVDNRFEETNISRLKVKSGMNAMDGIEAMRKGPMAFASDAPPIVKGSGRQTQLATANVTKRKTSKKTAAKKVASRNLSPGKYDNIFRSHILSFYPPTNPEQEFVKDVEKITAGGDSVNSAILKLILSETFLRRTREIVDFMDAIGEDPGRLGLLNTDDSKVLLYQLEMQYYGERLYKELYRKRVGAPEVSKNLMPRTRKATKAKAKTGKRSCNTEAKTSPTKKTSKGSCGTKTKASVKSSNGKAKTGKRSCNTKTKANGSRRAR